MMGKSDKKSSKYIDETPEERARRKETKKAEKLAKMLGYSNDINPFGDSNLLQPFVWGKKKEKEQRGKRSVEEEEGMSDKKRLKLIHEIEKVRKRRSEREAELEEMQRLRDEEQRLRESAQYEDFQQKEEMFALEQTRQRSKIRLIENREKPIDIIAKNILIIDAAAQHFKNEKDGKAAGASAHSDEYKKDVHLLELEGDMRNPIDVIADLNNEELKQLAEDIKAYHNLEIAQQREHVAFWEALQTVVKFELRKRKRFGASTGSSSHSNSDRAHFDYAEVDSDERKGDEVQPDTGAAAELAVHDAIANDVADLLRGKSTSELDDLQRDIDKNLRDGRAAAVGSSSGGGGEGATASAAAGDVEYWELLKMEVVLQRARAFVHESHVKLLRQQLELLSRMRVEVKASADAATTVEREAMALNAIGSGGGGGGVGGGVGGSGTAGGLPNSEAAAGSVGEGGELVDAMKRLEAGDREEKMETGDEVLLPGNTYWWQDKYRPRKPRYFNRVKTGWYRTKYNLSHYDHDNPPPKMIQGYKFTIFYPDLIDRTQTPKYFLEKCPESCGGDDFVIIRFHAGPPYEDVAFKIINKEWSIHRRSGFLCVFDRGVLQLNFNLKEHFYRR